MVSLGAWIGQKVLYINEYQLEGLVYKMRDNYSLGPDWFREDVAKAYEQYFKEVDIINHKYCFLDPRNGKVLYVNGLVHIIKGNEEELHKEMMQAAKRRDDEINRLKSRLVWLYPKSRRMNNGKSE
jgi:hypothetical protein